MVRRKSGIGRVLPRAKILRLKRAAETDEQREQRLRQQRERARARRANETSEEREERKAIMRKRRRQKAAQLAYQKRVQKFSEVLSKTNVKTQSKRRHRKIKVQQDLDNSSPMRNQQNEIYLVDYYCEQTMIEEEQTNQTHLDGNAFEETVLKEQLKNSMLTQVDDKLGNESGDKAEFAELERDSKELRRKPVKLRGKSSKLGNKSKGIIEELPEMKVEVE